MNELSPSEQQTLIKLAKQTIATRLGITNEKKLTDAELANPLFKQETGVFVTLQKNNQLRGCIGSLTPHYSIREGVENHALHAAFNDTRFPPVTPDEFDSIDIEISILSPQIPLEFSSPEDLLSKLKPGVHGVTLSLGPQHSATFLPQVWEQLPEPEHFLQHLSLKAGLGADGWQQDEIKIATYTVSKF